MGKFSFILFVNFIYIFFFKKGTDRIIVFLLFVCKFLGLGFGDEKLQYLAYWINIRDFPSDLFISIFSRSRRMSSGDGNPYLTVYFSKNLKNFLKNRERFKKYLTRYTGMGTICNYVSK